MHSIVGLLSSLLFFELFKFLLSWDLASNQTDSHGYCIERHGNRLFSGHKKVIYTSLDSTILELWGKEIKL